MTSLPIAFGAQIGAAAARHHLDPRLLAAVAAQETGGPGADSGRNIVGDGGHGRGLFQIDDRWHAFARDPAALDPARNADYAAGLLQANLQRYGGDVKAALSAYNTGSPTAPGTRTDWGDGRPLAYADSVLRHYARLGGTDVAAGGGPGATASAGDAPGAAPDIGELTSALQALAGQFSACAAPLQFAQRPPLPPVDQRTVADAAPSAVGDDAETTAADDAASASTT
jgi:Transglycosylase SLT domain